jgi:hypothetical protein
LVLLVLGLSRMTAEASPIKHHAALAGRPGSVQVWNEFVARGPAYWARVQHPTMSSQTSQTMHEVWKQELKSADPTAYPNIQYLLWRRSLDPARFYHWHPRLGQSLESILPPLTSAPTTTTLGSTQPQQILPLPTTTSGATPTSTSPSSSSPATSPSVVTPGSVSPETVHSPTGATPYPASIPEPQTLTLAAALCASELVRRLWNGRARATKR